MTAPDDNSIITATAPAEVYDKKNPFPSPLKRRVLLNKEGSDKETLHLELCLAGSGLEYRPGDSLAIIPANSPQAVGQVLEAGGFDAGETGELKGGETKPLGEVFATDLNITGITKNVLKKYNAFAQSEKLESLLDPDNKAALDDYLGGREVIDMIADFPVPGLAASDFCGTLRKQLPRLYSIASSLRAHPAEVHLTIAIVRYHSHGRDREGVCSTYTADRVDEGGTMPVFLHYDKNFKLPEDGDTPIIMVGPGTGIAPFRAFLEQREMDGASGRNWLIFGEWFEKTTFFYEEEFRAWQESGMLARLDTAFSRDQDEKVYVQHRLKQAAAEVWEWLAAGAYFYVCGDKDYMAKDVHQTLIDIVEEHGEMSADDAKQFVEVGMMKEEKRYLRDVY